MELSALSLRLDIQLIILLTVAPGSITILASGPADLPLRMREVRPAGSEGRSYSSYNTYNDHKDWEAYYRVHLQPVIVLPIFPARRGPL